MQSQFRILPGQSFEVAAGCTITFVEHNKFSRDFDSASPAVQLLVDGVGAIVTLNQEPLCDEHSIQVVAEDE